CDEESLDWIQYMLRNAASTPLLIVTTTRVEELTPDHTVLALTRSLHRTDQFAEIALQPLNSEETAALAQQVAGKTLNANEINALHADTEGNPLFIVEKIRAGSGGIMGAVKSGADTQMLSPKVQAIIEQRLAQLSPVARDLATFAAMLG